MGEHPLPAIGSKFGTGKCCNTVGVNSVVQSIVIPTRKLVRLSPLPHKLPFIGHTPKNRRFAGATPPQKHARAGSCEFWKVSRLGKQLKHVLLKPLCFIAAEKLAQLLFQSLRCNSVAHFLYFLSI